MPAKSDFRPYINRLLVIVVISLLFSIIYNEGSFLLQKEQYDRAPKTVQLVIPAGTAEQIEAGENPPSIPSEMIFVVGDVLEVKNEDFTSHQLGPVWVPAGATSRLVMEQASSFVYSCSFQTSRYLGIDVRQATTIGTRLAGLALVTPTTAALFYLYSLLIFPIKPKKPGEEPVPTGKA